jgi:Domain of unknown function (DUF4864)
MFTNRFRQASPPIISGRRVLRAAMTLMQVIALCGSWAIVSDSMAADQLAATDKRAIEQIIRSQLDAFGHDDADRAFGFATPDIQHMFGTSDHFMEMVREHYEPVYRAMGVRFVRLESVDGQWVQTVQITDGEGHVWRALFTMRRQPDKSWKVGGCQLVQTNAIAT